MFDDPQLNAAGAMMDISLGNGQRAPVPALPIEMKGKRFGLYHDVPRVGEDSAAILRDLGLSEDELTALCDEGIVHCDGN